MNKIKFLKIAVGSLLLINLGLIGFLFLGPHHPPHHNPKSFIIDKLHLDKEQVLLFEGLIEEHRSKRKEMHQEIMHLKNELYKTLTAEGKATAQEALINELGKAQQAFEQLNLAHFGALKKICRSEQLKDFDALMEELGELMKPPKPPHRK
jgi:hypothetical protein